MATWLITRHSGVSQWLGKQNVEINHQLSHLNLIDGISPGDKVIGVLPIHLIADLTSHGIRYFNLQMQIPLHKRGQELCASEMTEFGCQLVEYKALSVNHQSI